MALWREALLAQAVLKGRTTGYTRHPQLRRFQDTPKPAQAIARYLRTVHDEATRRGYNFDVRKIGRAGNDLNLIPVSGGQVRYEWDHLEAKLLNRDPAWLQLIQDSRQRVELNPVFHQVAGKVESWEKIRL